MPQPDRAAAYIHLVLDTSTSPPGCRGVCIGVRADPPGRAGDVLKELLHVDAATEADALRALGELLTRSERADVLGRPNSSTPGNGWITRMLKPSDRQMLGMPPKIQKRS